LSGATQKIFVNQKVSFMRGDVFQDGAIEGNRQTMDKLEKYLQTI
jgi:hypothetical protein